MTDIIIHKHSVSSGDIPAASEIDIGELAIQAADGHIYLKKIDGTVNRVTMLPGGDTQQVLYKTGAGNYALGWGTITSTLMGGALWNEVVAEVQRVFELVEGTASVLLTAPATLTAGSTGPITVSVADSSYLTDGTSITGVLGTVYGTLSRSGSTYSFVSNQSYTSDVTFALGTRFAAAFLNDTFNPLRIGSAEVEDDSSYADGSGYSHAVVDSSGRIGYGVKNDGAFDVPGGNINLDDEKVQGDDSYTDGSGYARVEVDAAGRIAWGVKADGSIVINKLIASSGTIDLDSVNTQLLNILEGGAQSGDFVFQEFYSHVVLDSADRIAYGVRPDGTVQFSKQIEGEATRAAQLTALGDNEIKEVFDYDFYVQIEVDKNDRITRGVYPDGAQYFPKAKAGELEITKAEINTASTTELRVGGGTVSPFDRTKTIQPLSSPPIAKAVNHLIVYGQSNALGYTGGQVISATQPYSNITFNGGARAYDGTSFDYSSFKPLVESGEVYNTSGTTTLGETPCSGAANYASTLSIVENGLDPANHVILASAVGKGGASIDNFAQGKTTYNLLLDHVNGAEALDSNYAVHAIAWIQGEANSGTIDYGSQLTQIRSDLETDIQAITGQTSPVYMITYQTVSGASTATAYATLQQLDAVRSSELICLSTPVYHIPHLPDQIHFSALGRKLLGAYTGRAYKQIVFDRRKPDFINPLSAYLRNGKIIARFDVPSLPLVLDSVNIRPTQDQGFRIVDDAGTVGISSIAINEDSIGNELVFTLSRSVSGAVTLRYALDYLASGVIINNGATGNLRDSTPDAVTIDGELYQLYHVCPHFKMTVLEAKE
jgi:hypothetical protein